jgi:hypothetical protein
MMLLMMMFFVVVVVVVVAAVAVVVVSPTEKISPSNSSTLLQPSFNNVALLSLQVADGFVVLYADGSVAVPKFVKQR